MAKNYLIITNAPSKYNAKLTETITQHIIGNTIKDDINNRTKQELTLSREGEKKSYNTTRDYSTYRIEINKKDDEPYMVQLSPFVRVDMNEIKASFENNESYKKAQKELQQLHTQYDTSFYSNYSPGNMTLYDLMNKKTSQLNHIKKSYGID